MFNFINKKPENKKELFLQYTLVFGMLGGLIVLGSLVGYNG